ncbi:alpha/beta hydrolase family protein [Alteromonas gracilis]|uniref:alpha/beta hydrolase family protein n=1 Tax=Alteromonas gracilis TaxID=1479524 RepID=UPI002FE18B13
MKNLAKMSKHCGLFIALCLFQKFATALPQLPQHQAVFTQSDANVVNRTNASSFIVSQTPSATSINNDTHHTFSNRLFSHGRNDESAKLSNVAYQPKTDIAPPTISKKDTHDKTGLKEDTHAKSLNVNSEEKAAVQNEKLTQVPYAALGVLPMREHDEQFSYGAEALQRVYVWHGRNALDTSLSGKAMVFVHGGCWLNAYGYEHAKGLYSALANLGMGVYVIEYRRVGDEGGGWPGSLNDVVNAINISLERITLQGDYSETFIAGHSAGGHLVLLATQQMPQQLARYGVKQVIGLAAITDIRSYALGTNSCQTATESFMKTTPAENPDAYNNASPNATLIHTPVVLLQGDADSIVPVQHATMVGAEKRIINNGGHFDWLHPESTSFDALLEVISEHD